MATGYGEAMAISVSGRTAAVDQPPMTEMESLSATMGETRRRLSGRLDEIEERLEKFAPQPKPMNTEKGLAGSEPPPGSLAALHGMANATGAQLNRLDAICARLRELL